MASTSEITSHDSSDSDNQAKRIKYENVHRRDNSPSNYRDEWEQNPEFKGWLKPVEGKPYSAKCIACGTEFPAYITVLRNHCKRAKHLKNLGKITENQLKITTAFNRNEAAEEDVSRAELGIAAFIVEHNLPIDFCDDLIPLLKNILPDSKIAQGMDIGRTKCIMKLLTKSHSGDEP